MLNTKLTRIVEEMIFAVSRTEGKAEPRSENDLVPSQSNFGGWEKALTFGISMDDGLSDMADWS
jgi:hypothetical protein